MSVVSVGTLEVDVLLVAAVPHDDAAEYSTDLVTLQAVSQVHVASGPLNQGGNTFTIAATDCTGISYVQRAGLTGEIMRLPIGDISFTLTPGRWEYINGATGDTTSKPVAVGSMLHVTGLPEGGSVSWLAEAIKAIRWTPA